MKKDENAFSKQQQEFTAMAVRSLPYLNSGMMQHFIQNPGKMGGLFQQLPFVFWRPLWKTYYENEWGRTFDWHDAIMLDSAEEFIELVVVLDGITEDEVLDKMVRDGYAEYPTSNGERSYLNVTYNCKRRTKKAYGIWFEEGNRYVNVYKDEKIELISSKLNASANLLERLLWSHFRRYWSFNNDKEPSTVCPSTISKDGYHFPQITRRDGKEYIYQEDYRGGYSIKKSQTDIGKFTL